MAYLFVHFTSKNGFDRENIWFSVSSDGLNWTDLGSEKPILTSSLGTKGIRDPFVVYDKKTKKYFMIATDLCTKKKYSWFFATRRGSRSILVWESEDLIHWSKERLCEVGIPKAGCVWAPEAIFCKEENKWLVFFASMTKEKGEKKRKQKIYATFTENFKTFSKPFKFFEGETDIIDTNIVWNDGIYYRFSKDETNRKIIIEKNETLLETEEHKYKPIRSRLLENFSGLEGPEVFYLKEQKKWCLIADQYRAGKGYLPLVADSLETGNFKKLPVNAYNMGKRKKRHGGVIEISGEKMHELIDCFGIDKG